jgi:dipeptidyl aminopeptidase/acylaminoacyl peptidase
LDRLVRSVDEMKRALFFSSLLAALAWSGVTSAASAKPTLTLADLRKQVSVSSPQIAPDGSRVLLLVSRRDFVKNLVHTNLVLIDVHTHAARDLVRDGRLSGVAWSPDGRFVAYVSEAGTGDEKANQLFVLPMDGGEPLQLTHERKGVEALAWRPDSRALAYVAGGEASNAKAIAQHDDAFDVTEEAWTAQAAPVADVLYEIASGGGTAHRIPHWSWNVAGGFTYAADGRSLFVTRTKPTAHPNRYLASEIVRVGVRDGEVTAIDALASGQKSPMRSADGRNIAYAFANPRGTMQSEIALADANGRHARFLTRRLDRNPDLLGFDPAGGVVVAANDATYRRLYRVDPDGSIATYPLGTLAAAYEASLAKDGTLAFTATAPDHPGELYVLLPHAAAPVRLTDYNAWIDGFSLGTARAVTWRTADGLTADGVLISPPLAKGTVPLVLYIHGGPTSASNLAFSGFPQVLAAHGWAVFEPNYRGSDNLGLVFARTTVPHIASVPGSDIELGLARVLSMHVADPSRIAVSGWSEGGLMTSWLIGHDTRWKAAVSGAAVNDWIGYSAMTDAKDFTPQFIGPSPWTDPSLMSTFDAESPLTYASNVKTPTLILSDAGDYRVPTPLAYEFYHDIRATGTPVQFVVYPVNGHFPSDPVRSEDVNRRWEAWLVKYL